MINRTDQIELIAFNGDPNNLDNADSEEDLKSISSDDIESDAKKNCTKGKYVFWGCIIVGIIAGASYLIKSLLDHNDHKALGNRTTTEYNPIDKLLSNVYFESNTNFTACKNTHAVEINNIRKEANEAITDLEGKLLTNFNHNFNVNYLPNFFKIANETENYVNSLLKNMPTTDETTSKQKARYYTSTNSPADNNDTTSRTNKTTTSVIKKYCRIVSEHVALVGIDKARIDFKNWGIKEEFEEEYVKIFNDYHLDTVHKMDEISADTLKQIKQSKQIYNSVDISIKNKLNLQVNNLLKIIDKSNNIENSQVQDKIVENFIEQDFNKLIFSTFALEEGKLETQKAENFIFACKIQAINPEESGSKMSWTIPRTVSEAEAVFSSSIIDSASSSMYFNSVGKADDITKHENYYLTKINKSETLHKDIKRIINNYIKNKKSDKIDKVTNKKNFLKEMNMLSSALKDNYLKSREPRVYNDITQDTKPFLQKLNNFYENNIFKTYTHKLADLIFSWEFI